MSYAWCVHTQPPRQFRQGVYVTTRTPHAPLRLLFVFQVSLALLASVSSWRFNMQHNVMHGQQTPCLVLAKACILGCLRLILYTAQTFLFGAAIVTTQLISMRHSLSVR
jgi:hypothetical protein